MSSPEILSPISTRHVADATLHTSTVLSKDSPASSQHSDRIKYSEIQSFLKLQPKKYVIIENAGKHTSHCWETFGFPALVHKDADPERIDGFVSSAQLKESEITHVKHLEAEWICQSIRPFSIVEDAGLRKLMQECISIGALHGDVKVDEVLRGADSIAAYISKLADQHRALITEELKEPVENDAIAFCPDMWTDPIRQISYLGITTTFINNQYEYRSYDLCCAPFEEENKSAENIITALQKELKTFSIIDLSMLKFVSDRG
ncbi:unnamed protein product [Rotaria magnacalcarata]|uniref:Hermes trasposase DNA-binding domain-containing protein n=1 Tax=Rotaria magnacalcarata TaxID=392030 RepID=A0A820FUR1_9BILA|nr:unnamed protein product [Rotaria magnacalcarata]CAF4290858.1 unnamed protein product [Rotaria magnacalcarata]